MKLLTAGKEGQETLCVWTENGVIDVAKASNQFEQRVEVTTDELIASGHDGLQAIRRLVDSVLANPKQASSVFLELDKVSFGPIVRKPEKIVCVGTNYRRHAIESNMPIPKTPVLFSKFNNSLSGHQQVVRIPAEAKKVDYEVELVIVMGKKTQNVSEEEALSYVFGYATGNDLSARDLQFTTGQWLLGKSCDGFAPVGPYLVTADEVSNPNDLALACRVNGEVRQSSNTKDMIFDCATLISYISRHMTLLPGDIIFTGTPEGVILGYPEAEQKWLQSGDEIEVSVEGLGTLRTVLE